METPIMDQPSVDSSVITRPSHTREVLNVNELDFVDFYKREYPSMVALASSLIGRSAEDIAQEAMIRAHQRWSTVSTYDSPGAWLRRVTINLATSTLRRRATRIRKAAFLTPAIPTVQWGAAEARFDDELTQAINSLPKNQRAAVVLHYLEDLSVASIADILECAPATAKVHLHRGRQTLSERLANQHEGTAS